MTKPALPSFSPVATSTKAGISAIETVFIIPILVIMLTGLIEVSNYIYAHHKVQNAAYNILHLNARTAASISDNFRAQIFDDVVAPVRLLDEGACITVIKRPHRIFDLELARNVRELPADTPAAPLYMQCQRCFGSGAAHSDFNFNPGGDRAGNQIPDNLLGVHIVDGEQLLVVETFSRYRSFFSSQLTDGGLTMQYRAIGRSRFGDNAMCDTMIPI